VKTSMPRIAFVHPELGIGGAERLIVDAALELQQRGARVTVFTARHDPESCFEETRTGALDIRVAGKCIPLQIGGRLRVPCAIARMACAALALASSGGPWDIVVCDLVPHIIPLLRLVSRAKIICYCHYPDRLLAPNRTGVYASYRYPIDRLEEAGLRMADRIFVNSQYTAGVFRAAFPRLSGKQVDVVYPGVDMAAFSGAMAWPAMPAALQDSDIVLLSLNRYDPGKNLELAVEALAELKKVVPEETGSRLHLIYAGSCDERLPESRALMQRLQQRAEDLKLADQVIFLRSVTDAERAWLMKRSICLVYTSLHEHFGIGIVEAMAAGRAVVAVNSGGPCETVKDGETGFLCEPSPEDFARAFARIVTDPPFAERMGREAQKRAADMFSRPAFGRNFDACVRSLLAGEKRVC
jgi:alpha-1,3/alpha-1,6-mannosyltransferase